MEKILLYARTMLAATPARWADLIEYTPADLLTRAPADGEWSALDCLQHMVDTERHAFPNRVRAILAGAEFPAFDPDAQGSIGHEPRHPADVAAAFAALRTQSVALLETVSEGDLGRSARHAELGVVTLSELLHEWVAHDLMHTVQAERALMQPFILGSGPWRFYFRDHDASL